MNKEIKLFKKIFMFVLACFILLFGTVYNLSNINIFHAEFNQTKGCDEHGNFGDPDYICFDKEFAVSKFDKKGTIQDGNYYLSDDTTLEGTGVSINAGTTVNLCLCGHVLSLNGKNILNNGTLNIYDCGNAEHHFTSDWSWDNTSVAENVVTGGVITGGGGISYIIGSGTTEYLLGGAILNKGTLTIDGVDFIGNSAAFGGAIFVDEDGTLSIKNSNVMHNIATSEGGGFYVTKDKTKAPGECFASGTLITMADGTTKKIDDVKKGDLVKTFDHENGSISFEEVFLTYKSDYKKSFFTLNFTNNITLSIVGCHDLFEKETLKYVTISENNYEDYVGKYFYNAISNTWEQLLSVTYDSTPVDFYSIYTAYHLNCIANNMLSIPDDTDYMLNVFEFDDSLKINQEQKQKDIEQYGLLTYDEVSDICEEEYFDKMLSKYAYISEGKGLFSISQMIETYNSFNKDNESSSKKYSIRKAANDVNIKEITLGSNTVVNNNFLKDNSNYYKNNIYLNTSCQIDLVEGATNLDCGILLAHYCGVFSSNISNKTDIKYFTSDSKYNITTKVEKVDGSNKYNYAIRNYYNVSYDLNGASGTAPVDSQLYWENDSVSLTTKIPTRAGYGFKGWSLSISNDESKKVTSYSVLSTDANADGYIVFYAIWGNDPIEEQPSSTNDYEVKVYDSLTGITYQWYKKVSGSSDVLLTNETNAKLGNTTLENTSYYCAIYKDGSLIGSSNDVTPVKVSFNGNGADGGSIDDIYQLVGRNITLPENSYTKDCSTFYGWNTSNTANTIISSYTVQADNNTLYVVWKDGPMFDLRWGFGLTYVLEEDAAEVLQPIRSGYKFGGWSIYKDGIGATSENLYISKGSNNVYDLSDFESETNYYAIWLNKAGNVVMFFENDSPIPFFTEDYSAPLSGFKWTYSTKTLELNNVSILYLNSISNEAFFCFVDYDINLVIKGTNNLGDSLSFDEMKYESYANPGTCLFGGIEANNITVTGDGSITIYDFGFGIKANDSLTFKDTFTGIVTIYDKGGSKPQVPATCCISASNDLLINGGTFDLYNDLTYSLNSTNGNIKINGGKIIAHSNNQAINAYNNITIPSNYKITGNDKYDGTGNNVSISVNNLNQVSNYSSAKYIRIEVAYTVKYNGNSSTGGTASEDSNKYYSGEKTTILTEGSLTKNGYKFLGWNTDKDATKALTFTNNEYQFNSSNLELYAIWESLGITEDITLADISLKYGDKNTTISSSITSSNSNIFNILGYNIFYFDSVTGYPTLVNEVTVSGDYAVVVYVKCTKDNYWFEGGTQTNYKGNIKFGTTSALMAYPICDYNLTTGESNVALNDDEYQNIYLYAASKITVKSYSVTYDANAGTDSVSNMPVDDNTYVNNSSVTISTNIPTRKGYRFVGWNTDKTASKGLTFTDGIYTMSSSNVTFYAIWKENHICNEVEYDIDLNEYFTLNDGFTLDTGNYYLSADLSISNNVYCVINSNVNICLNGYNLTFNTNGSYYFYVVDNCQLTFSDCKHNANNHGSFIDCSNAPFSQSIFYVYIANPSTNKTCITFKDIDYISNNDSFVNFYDYVQNCEVTFDNCDITINNSSFITYNALRGKGFKFNFIDCDIKSTYEVNETSPGTIFVFNKAVDISTINFKNTKVDAYKSRAISANKVNISVDKNTVFTSCFEKDMFQFSNSTVDFKGTAKNTYDPINYKGLYINRSLFLVSYSVFNLYSTTTLNVIDAPFLYLVYDREDPSYIYVKETINTSNKYSIYLFDETKLREGAVVYDFNKYNPSKDCNDFFTICFGPYDQTPAFFINDTENDVIMIEYLKFTQDLSETQKTVKTNNSNATYSWYNCTVIEDEIIDPSDLILDESVVVDGNYITTLEGDVYGEYDFEIPDLSDFRTYVCAGEYVKHYKDCDPIVVYTTGNKTPIKVKIYIKRSTDNDYILVDDSDMESDFGQYSDGYWTSEFDDSEGYDSTFIAIAFDDSSEKYKDLEDYDVKIVFEADTLWNVYTGDLIAYAQETFMFMGGLPGFKFYATYSSSQLGDVISGATGDTLPTSKKGSYVCKATLNDKFILSNILTIKTVDVTLDSKTYESTYSGNTQSYTLSGTDKGIGSFVIKYATHKDTHVSSDWSTTAPTTVGSYDVLITRAADETYSEYENVISNGIVIKKADYSMTNAKWDYTNPYTFSGSSQKVEVTGLPSGVTVKSYTNNEKTNSGDYTAKVTFNYDTTNYNEPKIDDLSWTINKATPTIDTTNVVKTYTYNSSEQIVNSGATVNNTESTLVYTNNKFTNVGTGKYTITISCAETTNYLATSTTVDVTVNKANYLMTSVKWNYTNAFTYDGNSHKVEVSGLPTGVTVKSYTDNEKTNSGDYTAKVTFNYDTANYNEPTMSDLVWSINKAQAVIDTTNVVKTYTYNSSEQIVNSGATVNNTESTLVYTNNKFTNVGTGKYTITISCAETTNYLATSKTVDVTVNKASYVMTGASWNYTNAFTYDGNSHKVEVSGLPTGVTVKSYTDNEKTNSGDYTAKVTFNYDTANYNKPKMDDLSWTINKATPSIDTTNVIKTYTYNGSEQIISSGATVNNTESTLVYTNNKFTNVGTGKYTITVSCAETTNYLSATTTVDITVNKQKVTEPTVKGTYKENGSPITVEFNNLKDYMSTTSNLVETNAGIYTVVFSLDENYEWNNNSDGIVKWEICKATLDNKDVDNNKADVIVSTSDGFDSTITVIVEVKIESEMSEENISNYDFLSEKELIGYSEKIGVIFGVKLVRTINGVKEEIQPSDIKPGTVLNVKLLIPEGVDTSKITKILHLHSKNDIDTISFNEEKMDDDRYYDINVDSLSEFVIVYKDECAIHFYLIVLFVIGLTVMMFLTFKTKKHLFNKKLNVLPVALIVLYAIALIVLGSFAQCVLCIVPIILNLFILIGFSVLYTLYKNN